MKIPVIIDCDPGIDDTIALCMANSSQELDIKAVTVVAGNSEANNTFKNALNIVDFLKMNARVARGAVKPLIVPLRTSSYAHGECGLADLVLPNAKRDFDKDFAWDVIYQEAVKSKGELWLIAIGPLTNVAIALFKYPNLKDYIRQIIVMGGSAEYGNATAYGEFNFLVDPHAAQAVFQSGIPIKMAGLNATSKAYLTKDETDEIFSSESKLKMITDKLLPTYTQHHDRSNAKGIIIHDAVAVAAVIDNSILSYKDYFVGVETKSNLCLGRTVVDYANSLKQAPNVKVAVNADKTKFIQILKRMMSYYN